MLSIKKWMLVRCDCVKKCVHVMACQGEKLLSESGRAQLHIQVSRVLILVGIASPQCQGKVLQPVSLCGGSSPVNRLVAYYMFGKRLENV